MTLRSSRRHTRDMLYTRRSLSEPNDFGKVTETSTIVPFQGVVRAVSSEETDGSTVLNTDKKVILLDPDQAQTIFNLKPEGVDTISIDNEEHSVVLFFPKHWKNELRAIDFVVRKYVT